MNARFPNALPSTILVLMLGCSSGSNLELPEPVASVDVIYANDLRATIDDMRGAEGPGGVVQNAQYALEDMEGYEETDGAADHLETYGKIYQGLEELSKMRGASREEVKTKVDALAALVDQLPKMAAEPGGDE